MTSSTNLFELVNSPEATEIGEGIGLSYVLGFTSIKVMLCDNDAIDPSIFRAAILRAHLLGVVASLSALATPPDFARLADEAADFIGEQLARSVR